MCENELNINLYPRMGFFIHPFMGFLCLGFPSPVKYKEAVNKFLKWLSGKITTFLFLKNYL